MKIWHAGQSCGQRHQRRCSSVASIVKGQETIIVVIIISLFAQESLSVINAKCMASRFHI